MRLYPFDKRTVNTANLNTIVREEGTITVMVCNGISRLPASSNYCKFSDELLSSPLVGGEPVSSVPTYTKTIPKNIGSL